MPRTNLFLNTPFAEPMRDVPIQCLDIGSRGGIEPDLLPIAFAVDAVGFEPDAAECERISRQSPAPWRSVRHIPAAVAGKTGTQTLHVAQDAISSSLLRPVVEFAERFNRTAHNTIIDTVDVETFGLGDAIDNFDIPPPDFIKLDVEGVELDILRSAPEALFTVAAIKTEVAFPNLRIGQPPARALDEFLTGHDFELLDIMRPAHWRRHGHVAHPMLSGEQIPYSRGQLIQCDYLYMRRPDAFSTAGISPDDVAERRLRAAWIAMAYGYFDRAEEYLDDPSVSDLLTNRWQITAAAALPPASRLYGWSAWRTAFCRQVRDIVPFLRYAATALLNRCRVTWSGRSHDRR
ncbi:MAG: FkbM family methyltransferase [Proteobacteria bacterium]|nr:FkbM family methyltransferase [Pseudomonadota bacterium]